MEQLVMFRAAGGIEGGWVLTFSMHTISFTSDPPDTSTQKWASPFDQADKGGTSSMLNKRK